jgi:hypothetical protein
MLARDPHSEHKPDANQHHVDQRKVADGQREDLSAGEHHRRLQQIAGPDEERIDRLLRVVLGFAAGRQEQRVTRGVLNRVIRCVLENLGPLEHEQYRDEQHRRVSAQRNQRQDEERAAHTHVLEDSRDGERLQQEGEDVHRREHRARERGNDRPPVGRRGETGRDTLVRRFRDEVVQHEPAERVHEVEDQHHQRDEEQVPIREDQLEAVPFGERLLAHGLRLLPRVGLPAVDGNREHDGHEQAERSHQHQHVGADTAEDQRRQQ